jgi:dTDP-glucose 4,6-dehydratase
MEILITGGAGFIGSNFIRCLVENRPDWRITNFDLLTYAGNPNNLADITGHKNYQFIKGDIADTDRVKALFENNFDIVVNFAAETHVDRSLYEPALFIKTNMIGTQTLLAQADRTKVGKFVHVSTDEVYGSLDSEGLFDENSPLLPNSPYAASKAGADLICRAYHKTYGVPVIIVRPCNNYGPYQFPEKLIPFFITRALSDEYLPLYGEGKNIRQWLHVEDNCRAVLKVIEEGEIGEIYNISGGFEITNLEITRKILNLLGKPDSLIRFVTDRPAHDFRYALDSAKIKRRLNWLPEIEFEEGLKRTIEWYRQYPKWLKDIISGDYRRFVEKHYRER